MSKADIIEEIAVLAEDIEFVTESPSVGWRRELRAMAARLAYLTEKLKEDE